MSLRAQVSLPVAAPALHTAAIAVHRRNPAPESIGNPAPYTIQRGVALRTCVIAKGLACDGRVNTVGRVERIPHGVCSTRVLRHPLFLYRVFPVDREWFLCGVNYYSPTFILPLVQRCIPSPLFCIEKEFGQPRGGDGSSRRALGRNKWRCEACMACHKSRFFSKASALGDPGAARLRRARRGSGQEECA